MRDQRGSTLFWLLGVVALAALLVWQLWPEAGHDVVLYCGVDQDQSRPMVRTFAEQTGLDVDYVGETEAFRSIGLAQRIEAEGDDPLGDVWWSNEIMHMVHLADRDRIAPLPEGLAEGFPPAWRDPRGRFIQFGARARVLLVNTELLPDESEHPKTLDDLLDPKWKERGFRTSMAAPLTGTTYTHAVAMLTRDEVAAKHWLTEATAAAKDGRLKLVMSNGQVMNAVADTEQKVAFGLTDTDDAWIAISEMGAPVKIIYPDQGDGQVGAVLIPNTAGIIRGAKHPAGAATLLKWLARPETERALAFSRSAQIPVRPDVDVPADGHIKVPGKDFRAAVIDWYGVGANKTRWHDWLTALFRQAE